MIKHNGRGRIWSSGLHHVYVNQQPARVYTPQYTIPETYQLLEERIRLDGGLRVGLDHIPEEVLAQYPLLSKIDPLNVGRITEIATDGTSIYALRTEHTNEEVAKLAERGELPMYSIVADFEAGPCENGQADYVVERLTNFKRADYVDEGGCRSCRVGSIPEDMVITARLSIGDDTLNTEEVEVTAATEEEVVESTEQVEETVDEEVVEADVEDNTETTEEEIEEEVTEEDDEEPDELEALKAEMAEVKQSMKILAEKAEAVDEIQQHAQKSRVEATVKAAIQAGKVLPREKDSLIEYGLGHEQALGEMLASRPVLVDFTKKSEHIEASQTKDDSYDWKTYQARRRRGYKI